MAAIPALRGFDADAFLRDHWQKRPLLMRAALAGWPNPIAPDDLAGLACEDTLPARLIVRQGDTLSVEHGPLDDDRFETLGTRDWTLLVQGVDGVVPEVAALLDAFRFIPNWRVDDVMVSYAADGGGVGPHFDRYDVFLLQGLGRRHWRVGGACDDGSALVPHDDLRLLRDFEAVAEYTLDHGDILYIPPGIAHDGVAVGGDCMTYSIGFRAPTGPELLRAWTESLDTNASHDTRYADPDLCQQSNPGAIGADALADLHALACATVADRDAFADWFGRHTTQPADVERVITRSTRAQLRRRLAKATTVSHALGSRFAFTDAGDQRIALFVDGHRYACEGLAANVGQQLCAQRTTTLESLMRDAAVETLLLDLLDCGSLVIDG